MRWWWPRTVRWQLITWLMLLEALSVGLFVGMVVCLEVGYRLGRRSPENPELTHEGIGAMQLQHL